MAIQNAGNCKTCGKRFIYMQLKRPRLYCEPCAVRANTARWRGVNIPRPKARMIEMICADCGAVMECLSEHPRMYCHACARQRRLMSMRQRRIAKRQEDKNAQAQ